MHHESTKGSGNRPRRVSPLGIAIAILSALPLIALCFIVVRYAVDLPLGDEWSMVPVIQAADNGSLSLNHLTKQQAEHRAPVTRLILLMLIRATDWDVRYEIALNLALGIAIFCAAAVQLNYTARSLCRPALLAYLPLVSLLLFSISQQANWLYGWQNSALLNTLCAMLTCFTLARRDFRLPHLALAGALAFLACFSFANGLLLWGIGLVALGLRYRRELKARWVYLALWIAMGTFTGLAYFRGYQAGLAESMTSGAFERPQQIAMHALAGLGAPLASWNYSIAMWAGAAGLLSFTAVTIRFARADQQMRVPLAPYLLVALYAIGTAGMIAVGRSSMGVFQAMSSRYISFSNLFWLGLIISISVLGHASTRAYRPYRLAATVAVALVIAALVGATEARNVPILQQRHHLWAMIRWDFYTSDSGPAMERLYYNPKKLRQWRPIVRERRLSVFRDTAPRPPLFVLDRVSLEFIQANPRDHSGRRFRSRATEQRVLAWEHRRRALDHLETNAYEQAEVEFHRSLELDPGNPETLIGLGTTLLNRGRPSEARPHLESALRHRPEDSRALANLGATFLLTQQWEEAARYLADAARFDPDDSVTQLNLGIAKFQLGDPAAARAQAEEALRLDPENEKAAQFLAFLEQAANAPSP